MALMASSGTVDCAPTVVVSLSDAEVCQCQQLLLLQKHVYAPQTHLGRRVQTLNPMCIQLRLTFARSGSEAGIQRCMWCLKVSDRNLVLNGAVVHCGMFVHTDIQMDLLRIM